MSQLRQGASGIGKFCLILTDPHAQTFVVGIDFFTQAQFALDGIQLASPHSQRSSELRYLRVLVVHLAAKSLKIAQQTKLFFLVQLNRLFKRYDFRTVRLLCLTELSTQILIL